MKACLVGIRLQNMVLQSDLKSQWRLEMAKRRGMCRKPSSAENLNRRTRLSCPLVAREPWASPTRYRKGLPRARPTPRRGEGRATEADTHILC